MTATSALLETECQICYDPIPSLLGGLCDICRAEEEELARAESSGAVESSNIIEQPLASEPEQEPQLEKEPEPLNIVEPEQAPEPLEAFEPPAVPTGSVVFDLETASADRLHDHPNPREFVRIAGRTTPDGEIKVEPGPDEVIKSVLSSRWIIGANHVAFDIPALQRIDPRVDILALARERRLFDVMIADSVLHPVMMDKRSGEVERAQKWFALDAMAERYGIRGKTDSAKRLANKYGGFDQVPVDDPEYIDYCRGDVAATRELARILMRKLTQAPYRLQEYLWREHRVHAIASQMGMSGFAVDQALLQRRYWQSVGRKADLTRKLIKKYNIPTTKADGKPADSPASTKEGKAAILKALLSLGVSLDDIPKTPKGQPSFGGDAMAELAELYADHSNGEEIAVICETVGGIASVRTVYDTALKYLKEDGKVHPEVVTFQASGRWSVRKPGLTVFGKRGGRVVERAVFTASDPDHVLVTIDLSQIDARAIAVHSQDPNYMAMFEPGLDAHEEFARMVWGNETYDSNPKHYRQQIKAITHGLPYGMGVHRLAEHAKVPLELAQKVVDVRRERFPRLVHWENEVREQAASGGFLDNGFGRQMRPDPERAHTQGPALMGQGTARDLMMQCLINVDDMDPQVMKMLRVQIHDEAVWEVPKKDFEEVRRIIEKAFNFEWAPPGASRPIKIIAECDQPAFRWSDCY